MRSPRKASLLQSVAGLFLVLLAAPAAAQDADEEATARAREQFAEGVQCVERQDWACAEEHFRAALELHEAPAVRYNLASALYEQRRYTEANALNEEVLANPETTEAIRAHAVELRQAIQEDGTLATVTVHDAPDDAELRVDGYSVPRESWSEVPVAPGQRTFALYSGDRRLTEIQVEAEPETPLTVALTVVASPEEAAAGGGGGGVDFDALFADPIFWGVAGGSLGVVVIIIIIVAVAASSGSSEPVNGDFQPGVLTW